MKDQKGLICTHTCSSGGVGHGGGWFTEGGVGISRRGGCVLVGWVWGWWVMVGWDGSWWGEVPQYCNCSNQ